MRLAAIVLFLVGFTFGSANAERKVDWSQYLEKPGERPPKKDTPRVAADAGKKKVKKAPRASAKRPAKAVAKKRTGRRR